LLTLTSKYYVNIGILKTLMILKNNFAFVLCA